MRTRLQARSAQPAGLVTPPRAYPPGNLENFRQASAGVNEQNEERGPSNSFADGGFSDSGYSISRCKDRRCKTCPRLLIQKFFYSTVTGKRHSIVNPQNKNISCKIENIIYLLTCESCFLQYVGETAMALNLRMNIHRTSKKGCEHIIHHFKNVVKMVLFLSK